MDSLKKLLEQKKPTNIYKSAEPESSTKSHVNSYQKDLGLIDSPLEKRVGAPAGTIQKAMLIDKRRDNLPTCGQIKAQRYESRRRRILQRPTQNPELGGTVKVEEDVVFDYRTSNSSQGHDGNNPLREEVQGRIPDPVAGGHARTEEATLQAIQSGGGQPPAKIGNPRGGSGSSGVYRTTVGPLKSVSRPGVSHTAIDSKWENQDEIGLGNVTRPQVEGRDKVTPSFAYTEFVQVNSKKKADGHQLVKQQLEKWKK
jgi:hypothetical protein